MADSADPKPEETPKTEEQPETTNEGINPSFI